jgi:hypothetical protein
MNYQQIFLIIINLSEQLILHNYSYSISNILLMQILSIFITSFYIIYKISKIPIPIDIELLDDILKDVNQYITITFVILSNIVIYYS